MKTPTPTTSKVRQNLRALADRPKLATTQEISAALGLSEQVTYTLARDGRLPVVHFGRMLRFDAGDLLEFLARGGTQIEAEDR